MDTTASPFDFQPFERTCWRVLDALNRAVPETPEQADSFEIQELLLVAVIEQLTAGTLPVVVINADVGNLEAGAGARQWLSGTMRHPAPVSLMLAPVVVHNSAGQAYTSSASWLLVAANVGEGVPDEAMAVMRFEVPSEAEQIEHRQHHILTSSVVFTREGNMMALAIPPELAFQAFAGREPEIASVTIDRVLALLQARMMTPTVYFEGPSERAALIDRERHLTPDQPIELVTLLQTRQAHMEATTRRAR